MLILFDDATRSRLALVLDNFVKVNHLLPLDRLLFDQVIFRKLLDHFRIQIEVQFLLVLASAMIFDVV